MSIYSGINNIGKKIKSVYIGQNDIAKKITKGYAGVSNISEIIFGPPIVVKAGKDYSMLLLNNGTLYGCGYNNPANLGLGDHIDRITLTQITTLPSGSIKEADCGFEHSMALLKDGTLWCTGNNDWGQLGLGDRTNRTTFTQVPITI
jgi:hypothetical protein